MRPPPSDAPAGAYVHLPFCRRRCSYCDFAIAVGRESAIDRYVDALVGEIAEGQPELGSSIDTYYLGGGTPSLLAPASIARVLGALADRSELAPVEVTIEGNPEDLDPERLDALARLGVTRLSLGLQSLDANVLRGVGRLHDGERGLEVLRQARDAGLDVSVDLIVGLPGERLERWRDSVERVLAAGPDHLSLYTLEIDKPTPLARALESGRVEVPRGPELVETFLAAREAIEAAGLAAYELASFARPGKASRHNLKYWNDAWYGGFGVGAHGYAQGARRGNTSDLDRYLERCESGRDPVAERDPWDAARRLEEAAFCGLRNREGLDLGRLARRYGEAGVVALDPVWREGVAAGRLEREGPWVRFTVEGLTAVDEVLTEIVGNPAVAAAIGRVERPGDAGR